MFFRKKTKKQFMITLPDPCKEDWGQMRVVDNCHRHCAACDRVLTDFAQMNDDELLLFFRQSQEKVCGRFRRDQLNRPLVPIPEKTTKAVWWKAALLLPFSLFSKNTFAQQPPGDTVQVVQNDSASAHDPVPAQPVTLFSDSEYIWFPPVSCGESGAHYQTAGGVPYMITVTPTVTTGWCVFVDTVNTTPPPPETGSSVGVEAAAAPAPVKNSSVPKSAKVARKFGRMTHNDGKEE